MQSQPRLLHIAVEEGFISAAVLDEALSLQQTLREIGIDDKIGRVLMPYEMIGGYQEALTGKEVGEKSLAILIISDSKGPQCKIEVSSRMQNLAKEE